MQAGRNTTLLFKFGLTRLDLNQHLEGINLYVTIIKIMINYLYRNSRRKTSRSTIELLGNYKTPILNCGLECKNRTCASNAQS